MASLHYEPWRWVIIQISFSSMGQSSLTCHWWPFSTLVESAGHTKGTHIFEFPGVILELSSSLLSLQFRAIIVWRSLYVLNTKWSYGVPTRWVKDKMSGRREHPLGIKAWIVLKLVFIIINSKLFESESRISSVLRQLRVKATHWKK